MTAELATLNAAYRQPRSISEHQEFTFADIGELCAFVQREIGRSKFKYKQIAEKGGVCASTVGRMAAGETQHPRAETVFAMLRVLGFEVVVRS